MPKQADGGCDGLLYGRQRNIGVVNFILDRRADPAYSVAPLSGTLRAKKNIEQYSPYCSNSAIAQA
jgi:hypothetical protein